MSRDEENIDDPTNAGENLPPESDPTQEQDPNAVPADQAGAEADALFAAPEASTPSEEFGQRPQFDASGNATWGGDALTPEEIGIPVEKQPGYLSSEEDFGFDSEQELELIDDEAQLGQQQQSAGGATADEVVDGAGEVAADEDLVIDEPVAAEAAAETEPVTASAAEDGEALEGEFFVLDETENAAELAPSEPGQEYPVEEGWEPVESVTDLPGEATPIEPATTEPEPAMAGGGADEMAATYAEEPAPAVLVAAPRRVGRVVRMLASVAAAVVVVGAGAVVVLRPEWLGLHFEPQLVERVQVARPSATLRVPTPVRPAVPERMPDQIAVTPPSPVRPPVGPEPMPTMPTPTTPTPTTTPDAKVTPPATDAPAYLPVGETMWIGSFDGKPRAAAEWANVRLGAKAFAQLQNGNFFVGSVKAVNSTALILTVPAGEVTLLREDVDRVATLDSQDYLDLQQATTGFLRLNNRNRLAGTILKSVADDNYVLQMRSDRIVVPKSVVEQFVAQPGTDGLRFSDASDEEEWLRTIAVQQLQAMKTGARPAPSGEGRASQKREPVAPPLPKAKRTPPVEKPGK